MFHFLEHHDRRNPFGDEPDVPPKLDIMQPEEYAELKENIDTEEEMDWGELMREGRMQFLTNLANGTAVTGKVFPNSELKDFASKAERAERLEAGLPVGPAKGDGPVPMSVARVKDAQAIVSRKLKRNIERGSEEVSMYQGGRIDRPIFTVQSPSAYDEAPRKKRRPNGLASSPARHSTAYSPAEAASPDPLEGGLVLPRIDTRGIPEDRLEALRRQADIELGPSPLPSPEISWRDFEPELKPFGEIGSSLGTLRRSPLISSLSQCFRRIYACHPHGVETFRQLAQGVVSWDQRPRAPNTREVEVSFWKCRHFILHVLMLNLTQLSLRLQDQRAARRPSLNDLILRIASPQQRHPDPNIYRWGHPHRRTEENPSW